MAAKSDIVRVSYRDLENLALRKDENRDLSEGHSERKGERNQKRQRQKRPTRGIYQPPSILRHKQQLSAENTGDDWNGDTEVGQDAEDWEEEINGSTCSSKENSVEKEVDAVISSLRTLQTEPSRLQEDKKNDDHRKEQSGPTASGGRKSSGGQTQGDGKRRSKRPEIQRYIPKGKILHAQNQQEAEDWEEEKGNNSDEGAVFTPLNRKVDVDKSEGLNMKVTVVLAKGESTSQSKPTQESHVQERSRTGSDGSTTDNTSQRPKVLGEENVEKPDQKGQFGWNKNKQPHWDRGNRQNDGKKFGQDSRRQGQGPKGHNLAWSGERTAAKQGRQNENWDDQYGTWPREKDKSKGNKKPSPQKKVESWESSDLPSDNLADSKSAATEAPKPQRMQQRKPRGGGVTRVGKQTTVSVMDAEWEPDNVDSNLPVPTMIFERRSSASSITEGSGNGNNNLKQKPPKGQTLGKSNMSKRYSLSTLRRPRAGSVSSDVSTASDLSIDEETTTRILDWDKEVEREMAKQVQDETLKLQEFLERQGEIPGWDLEIGAEGNKLIDRSTGYVDVNTASSARASEKAYRPSRAKEKQFAERKKHSSGSNDRQYKGERSEHWYGNEGNHSRRKDRRRNSTNGRSRDSSVSSVHSVQSYQGDDDMYHTWSLPRKGRRRRRSSNTSLKDLSSSRDLLNDPESPNLKVTFAQNEQRRQVIVQNQGPDQQSQGVQRHENQGQRGQGHRGRGRGRARSADRDDYHQREDRNFKKSGRDQDGRDFGRGHNSGQGQSSGQGHSHEHHQGHGGRGRGFDRDRNWDHQHDTKGSGRGQTKRYDNRRDRRNSGRESPMHEQNPSTHAGGLIKLPPSSSYMPGSPQEGPHQFHGRRGEGGQPREENRGRGGNFRENRGGHSGQRMLFDPKHPNKPIMIKDHNSGNPGNLSFQETGHEAGQGPPPTPPTPSGMYHPGFPPNYYGNFDQRFTEAGYPAPPPPPPQHPGYFGYPYPHPMPGMYRDNPMYHEDVYPRDSYYQSEFDSEQAASGRSRTQCRAMAERTFQEALPLDSQLANLVSRRITNEELQLIHQLRHDLQNKYEQIMLWDIEFANKQNIEQLLWKSVYYQVIEVFRKHLAEEKDEDTKTQLSKILNEGTDFYEQFLQKLQKTYNFQLDVFLDTNTLQPENVSRSVKQALLIVQRNLICLGDISRYREQSNNTGKVNYGRARSWYTKAQQLAPKNGRPYNQLAILALHTRRKLDAVYYYMRSLAASNPFLTARESLMSLFDEARKKAENSEKKREQEKERTQKLKQHKQKHGERIEIWVSADGTSTKGEEDGMDELSKLDAVEINKRFVLSFLNVHGKLFTKIGRETFPECCGQMLKEFQALLKQGAIGPTRLLQLMAINMFAIENTALKNGEYSDNFRSELQEHAVQLGLDMFGILVNRCSDQLLEHLKSDNYPTRMFSRELEELVPGMKVWADWMFCHSYLWNPPPQLRDTSIGPEVDVWQSLAVMFSILKDVDTSHVKLYKDKREGCDPVILSEDVMLAGFVPLLSLPQEVPYVHSTVDKEIAQDCSRISKLKDFGDYLCGIENPVLAFDVVDQKFYSIAPPTGYSEEEKGDLSSDDNLSDNDDVIVESEEEIHGMDDEHVRQLREKKEELKRRKKEQEQQKENIQKILEKNRHRCIELEIHPIFLIPDTNCFIDHLPSLKKLMQIQKFTITIPLVVINELDGLAKGSREGQYDSKEHANKVKTRAGETIQYLEEEFEKKNSHLRAQTAKGNIMETIAFRSEETEESGNNDDVILSCCLHYCKDKAREFMPREKDAPVRLYRDVVLLTDDRNLCLKAHTCNVPVKDVPSFMKWAKIT